MTYFMTISLLTIITHHTHVYTSSRESLFPYKHVLISTRRSIHIALTHLPVFQFERLASSFPKDCIYKADQWVLLSRRHVKDILALPRLLDLQPNDLFRAFEKVRHIRKD